MIIKKLLLPLVATILLLMAISCFAQSTSVPKGISLRIGAFMPARSFVSDTIGSSMLDVRLGYDWKDNAKSTTTLETGWFGSTKNDNNFQVYPLDCSYKVKTESKFFYGAGAGLYFAKINEVSKTHFGLHVLSGWAFTDIVDLEARYTNINGNLDGQNISGWSIFLAGKF